jgi:hypothetical protein
MKMLTEIKPAIWKKIYLLNGEIKTYTDLLRAWFRW